MLHCVEHLVFVDESGFFTHMHRSKGKSRRGRRVVVKKRKKSARYTVIGAVRLGSLFAREVWGRAMTKEDFEKWVAEVLVPELNPGDLVIWDNLNIHYSGRAKAAIDAVGCAVLFQSRYSPDLNPIEKVWSKLKALVRRVRPKGARPMKAALADAWMAVTEHDIESYFIHCLIDNVWQPPW